MSQPEMLPNTKEKTKNGRRGKNEAQPMAKFPTPENPRRPVDSITNRYHLKAKWAIMMTTCGPPRFSIGFFFSSLFYFIFFQFRLCMVIEQVPFVTSR